MTSLPIPPSILVARFLRSNNYPQTLAAFIKEAGLPDNAGLVSEREHNKSEVWTIEKIIQEKIAFDKALSFERDVEGAEAAEAERWTLPGECL